jgi:uncharacterized protein YjbI with pentapeptide repeats
MPNCKHYAICGLGSIPGKDLCILHCHNSNKDHREFAEALAEHRKKNGDNFRHFVFPGPSDFSGATFDTEVDFYDATFTVLANFSNATFTKRANFLLAKFDTTAAADFAYAKFNDGAHFTNVNFRSGARFPGVEFTGLVDFSDGKFAKQADFSTAKFNGPVGFCETIFCEAKFESTGFTNEVDFFLATFAARANFFRARFADGADFSGASFAHGADFSHSMFLGITLFVPWKQEGKEPHPIFSGIQVDFRDVIIAPLDAVVFRDADLRKCHFLGTDLRKAELANVTWPEIISKKWPRIGRRLGVYDEVWADQERNNRSRPHIEQLYRQLKQNYEDRRNYEMARDFHYGEKEMRRKNLDNPLSLRLLLKLYCCVSGYGERSLPPLVCAAVLLVASSVAYLGLGLWSNESKSMLEWSDWLSALGYSFRVMTLLKPDDLVPIGYAKAVSAAQSLAGPILLGLFALALRQRLKR